MFARLFQMATLAVAAGALTLAACGERGDGDKEVRINMSFSAFEPQVVEVRAGEPVTFQLVNEDPIEHEWMVGDESFHALHRTGTHAFHDSVPEEVTVPALESRETTLTFAEPGDYAFICHLPGHEEYGMRGVVRVTG